MTISRFFLLPALLLALVAAGCGGGSSTDVPKDAVAVVDGREIPRTEFDDLINLAKTSYKNQKRDFPAAGSEEYQALRNQAVQHLVEQVQLDQAAEDMGIEVTDKEVDARLEQIKKQFYGGDQAKFDKALKEQSVTSEQVRDNQRDLLISEKIFNDVTKDVKVSDADVQKNYDQNRPPDSRDVRHILVKTKALADSIRAQLTPNGSNFAALVRQHTTDTSSKPTGGKLTIARGQTVAAFDKVAFALKTKEISAPVKTTYGYHIIQALADVKKAGKNVPVDQEAAIRQQLLQAKKNEKMTAWIEDLKDGYEDKVAYAVGFTPPPAATTGTTGTTTNEQ